MPVATLKTFDPAAVTTTFNGAMLSGYTDGTFISIERNNDSWALKVGCDGIGSRAKSNDRSGRVTLTFHQSSQANDTLSNFALADELTNTGVGVLLIRDASGRTLVSAQQCWITKPAVVEFGREIADRVWVLESADIAIFVGGN